MYVERSIFILYRQLFFKCVFLKLLCSLSLWLQDMASKVAQGRARFYCNTFRSKIYLSKTRKCCLLHLDVLAEILDGGYLIFLPLLTAARRRVTAASGGELSWESAGLLSGRSRVQTPIGPTLGVFK